ncbi:MAG: DinB family protein [Rubricoccaceae bacterium]
MSATASRPAPSESGAYYHRYIAHVPDGDILDTLGRQLDDTAELLAGVEDGSMRYAPDKWTVRQVLIHMIDTERVFAYRALRFARGDETPLPGYDQDEFMQTTDVSERSIASLLDEFRSVRASTLSLLRGLDDAAWDRAGVASGHPMTTRGAVWVIAGHERHHAAVLRDRYLAA